MCDLLFLCFIVRLSKNKIPLNKWDYFYKILFMKNNSYSALFIYHRPACLIIQTRQLMYLVVSHGNQLTKNCVHHMHTYEVKLPSMYWNWGILYPLLIEKIKKKKIEQISDVILKHIKTFHSLKVCE